MDKNNQSTKTANKIILLIIIIIIIIILGIILSSTSKNNPGTEQPINKQNNNKIINKNNDGFPGDIYSYVGTIKNIKKNKIIIQALKNKNYLQKDTEITVLINEETIFNKIIIPKKIDDIKIKKSNKLFKKEIIQLSDLKINDEITAISYDNIKGKTEFLAKRIEKIVVE